MTLALSTRQLGSAQPLQDSREDAATMFFHHAPAPAEAASVHRRGTGYSAGEGRGIAFFVALALNGILLLALLALGATHEPVERDAPLTTFTLTPPPSAAPEPPAPDVAQPVQQSEPAQPQPDMVQPAAFTPAPPVSLGLRQIVSAPVIMDTKAIQPAPAAMVNLSPAAPAAPVVAAAPVQAPVTPPNFSAAQLGNAGPKYPYLSRKAREEGVVMLRVLVNTAGRAAQLQVNQTSGHDRLDQAALDTVRKWRFAPAKRAGTPVEAWVLVPVTFALD